MNKTKVSILVLIVGIAVVASAAVPLLSEIPIDQEFGPACCRFSNECPGSQTCGSTTGCSAGAPYTCG